VSGRSQPRLPLRAALPLGLWALLLFAPEPTCALTPSGLADADNGLGVQSGEPPVDGSLNSPSVDIQGPHDPAELAAFLDGLMRAQMTEKQVRGAVVAVVRGGEILLARGYGYADAQGFRPVDPASTLFRIGSVSKLFTWMAVMQQVEAGRLDLDADVNAYLDFTIPPYPGGPITLWHLLTHTPGFEEDSRDLFIDEVDLGGWLRRNIPGRVRPVGQFSAYSNYGTSLAGYIVERVSGRPWDDYLEQEILRPLGMTQSTGRQPLPDALAPSMSEGLEWAGGQWEARPFEMLGGSGPAGSMSASGLDMARFMLWQLPSGLTLEGPPPLSSSTVERMHARTFTHDERINGFGLGFYEKSSHGLRIVGHGGNTRWFHSDLALIPELDLGIFVSYNSAGGAELSLGPFLNAFLNHYFPFPPAPLASQVEGGTGLPGWEDRLRAISGTWRFNRASETTFQKAMGLVGGVKMAPAGQDGTLLLSGLPGGELRLVETEPYVFENTVAGGVITHVIFRQDDRGRPTHAFTSATPMMALERAAWHTLPTVHLPILGVGLATFLLLLLRALVRLAQRLPVLAPDVVLPEAGRALRRSQHLMVGVAGAYVVFAAGVGILVSDPWSLLSSPFTGLRLVLVLPVVGTIFALAAAAFWGMAVRRSEGPRWVRRRTGASILLALLMAWSLHTWNLLGWHF
jgi:CubicO group peptidase (beta-lactamase class C family)